MIGGEAFAPLNVSYNIIDLILKKQIPVETNITLNWIERQCIIYMLTGHAFKRT